MQFVAAIVASGQKLKDLSHQLRSSSRFSAVSRQPWYFNGHDSSITIDQYISIELLDGRAVDFGIEIHLNHDANWIVSQHALVTSQHGQGVLRDFPDKVCLTLESFTQALDEATEEVIDVCREILDAVSGMPPCGLPE